MKALILNLSKYMCACAWAGVRERREVRHKEIQSQSNQQICVFLAHGSDQSIGGRKTKKDIGWPSPQVKVCINGM